jgi:hypothetical protein
MKELIETVKRVLIGESGTKFYNGKSGYSLKVDRQSPELYNNPKTILSDDEQSVEIASDLGNQWSTIFGAGKKLGLWTSSSKHSAPATFSLKLVGDRTHFNKLISALKKTKLKVSVKKLKK